MINVIKNRSSHISNRVLLSLVFVLLMACAVKALSQGMETNDAKVKAGFNHFYVMVDQKTMDLLLESRFLREKFSVTEYRTTSSLDGSGAYTGLYLYGDTSYMEFVLPYATDPNKKPGDTGLAFGVDGVGLQAELVASASEAEKSSLLIPDQIRKRVYKGTEIDWFSSAFDMRLLPKEPNRLLIWMMEYSPTFLTQWHPDLTPVKSSVSRKDVLKRYKAVTAQGTEVPVRPIMKDIVGVKIEATDSYKSPFENWLSIIGFDQDAAVDSWRGKGARIDIQYGAESTRIKEIIMSIDDSKDSPKEISFGDLLSLKMTNNGTARWVINN